MAVRKAVIFLVMLIFLSSFVSAALGISPARKQINFVPGQTVEINYNVISDDPNREIEIYTSGELSEFATVSKSDLTGPGSFKLTLILPKEFDVPGPHELAVGVREKPREDSFIGTRIDISSVITVFVPYPGEFAEVELNINDGNVDDFIPVETKVINRGQSDLNVDVKVDFYASDGGKEHTLDFTPVIIPISGERFFRKILDTAEFRAGSYTAIAVVNYGGEETTVNKTFRIGSLFANVTSFTDNLPKKGIQKFYINVESGWNNELKEVFADVNLTKEEERISFRTPSVDLEPWGSGVLEGFIDTDNLDGVYDVAIDLQYSGLHTFVNGELVIRETNMIVYVIGGILIVVVLIIVIWYIRKHNHKKYKKYKSSLKRK